VRERAGESADTDLSELFGESVVTSVLVKGWIGVDVFFAISGFILGLPFSRHFRLGEPAVALGPYFLRRLSRLEVPYVLSLLLAFLALGMLSGAWPWTHLLASCFYVHGLVFGDHSAVNPVSWSLEIEVQFYCLAPLLAFVLKPSSRAVRISLMIAVSMASIALRTRCADLLVGWHLHESILVCLHCFMTGFMAIELYDFARERGPRASGHLADLLGCLGVAWLFLPIRFPQSVELVAFIPATLSIFAAASSGTVLGRLFRNRWIVTIGGMCYSIYLIHYGAMTIATGIIGPSLASVFESAALTSLLFALTMIPVALVPSAAFFLLVERPCMQRGWFRRLLGAIHPRLSEMPRGA
jgi:peptidoglycan/LPS O-acetylase OafA/YrhL